MLISSLEIKKGRLIWPCKNIVNQYRETDFYGAPYWTLLQTFDICAKLQFDMLIVI